MKKLYKIYRQKSERLVFIGSKKIKVGPEVQEIELTDYEASILKRAGCQVFLMETNEI